LFENPTFKDIYNKLSVKNNQDPKVETVVQQPMTEKINLSKKQENEDEKRRQREAAAEEALRQIQEQQLKEKQAEIERKAAEAAA
jgi:hypothetical protein